MNTNRIAEIQLAQIQIHFYLSPVHSDAQAQIDL